MAEIKFTKATKSTAKLRLALFGPSGSGKTYSALRMAKGLGGTIGFIDTERGSASKYADRFDFDVLELTQETHRNVDTYCAAIATAQSAGYQVLIIDSLTHAWFELLDEVDKLARAKYAGNTWSAWSEGTPRQRRLVDALLGFPGHIIATMRTKTEWTLEKDEKTGKNRPVRIGLAPEQGKGVEYEFDLLMELSPEHIGLVLKDRTGKFQDRTIDKPDEAFGASLAAWLTEGSTMPSKPTAAVAANGARPYTPLQLKARFAELVGEWGPKIIKPLEGKQRDIVAANLEFCFASDEQSKSKCHELQLLLTGKGNFTEWTDAEVRAARSWLNVTQDSGGAYSVNPLAAAEARMAVEATLKASAPF